MRPPTRLLALLLVLSGTGVARSMPTSQELAGRAHELPSEGLRLWPPREWRSVPVEPRLGALGVVARFSGPTLAARVENVAVDFEPALFVLSPDRPRGDRSERSDEDRSTQGRVDPALVVPEILRGLRTFDEEAPLVDERLELRGGALRLRRFRAEERRPEGRVAVTVELWEPEDPAGVALVFYLPTQHAERHATVFRRAARSLESIERVEAPLLGERPSYEELLAYHQRLCERTPGWRALATPSRRYIVKTSSSNEHFVEEAIVRLERARERFEHDLPPPEAADGPPEVAVVRICADEDEFRVYGDTPEGVVGWYSPRTGELVLYDSVATDRNVTYAVMVHEAFHQYARIALGGEAHPWFEEGHGDYYAGLRFGPRRATVGERLPGELDRRDAVRALVREKASVPLARHLRARGSAWREEARSPAAAYAQSWSLVGFLRRGMQGEVSGRVWDVAYGRVLPRYTQALRSGWRALCEDPGRPDGPPDVVERALVLDAAVEAALEEVDPAALEEDWMEWVERFGGG